MAGRLGFRAREGGRELVHWLGVDLPGEAASIAAFCSQVIKGFSPVSFPITGIFTTTKYDFNNQNHTLNKLHLCISYICMYCMDVYGIYGCIYMYIYIYAHTYQYAFKNMLYALKKVTSHFHLTNINLAMFP